VEAPRYKSLWAVSYTLKTGCSKEGVTTSIQRLTHTLLTSGAASNTKPVARASGFFIFRDRLGGQRALNSEMDEVSNETFCFAATLWESCTHLREVFASNPAFCGSGVWGHGLDEGNLVYLESIKVDSSVRRQGFGTWLLAHILSDPKFAISSPRPGSKMFRLRLSPCLIGLYILDSLTPEEREEQELAAVGLKH
jgi:hypothetical protein